jgi:hypothetical protein
MVKWKLLTVHINSANLLLILNGTLFIKRITDSDTSREVPEDYHIFLCCILQHPDDVDYKTSLMMLYDDDMLGFYFYISYSKIFQLDPF